MTPYSISCTTCGSRLKVRDERAIGQLCLCAKCGSMVMVTPPSPSTDSGPQTNPSASSSGIYPKLVVGGGGSLASDFEDAAALLADTVTDLPPKSSAGPMAPNASAQPAQPSANASAAAAAGSSGIRRAAASGPPAGSPTEPGSLPTPPPITQATESISSIELDLPEPAGLTAAPSPSTSSPRVNPATHGPALAAAASSHQLSASAAGSSAPPPLVPPTAWESPSQRLMKKIAFVGVGAMTLLLLASLGVWGVVRIFSPAAPQMATGVDPTSASHPAATKPALEAGPSIDEVKPPPAEVKPTIPPPIANLPGESDLSIPKNDPVASVVDETPKPEPSDANQPPKAGEPPIFTNPEKPQAPSVEVATADTGLGEFTPLVDAFPTRPAFERKPTEDKPDMLDVPIPSGTASLPRPDTLRINVKDRLADKIAGIDVKGVPLVKFTETLTQLSTIPITIDAESLAQVRAKASDPITLSLKAASVEEILNTALKPARLSFRQDGEQLVITAAPRTSARLVKVRYTVNDLVGEKPEQLAQLTSLITAVIEPESWEAAGGDGTASTQEGAIVINNTPDVHFGVLVLCEKLRVARGLPLRSKLDPAVFAVASRTSRVSDKLKTPITATFYTERPLLKIVDHLRTAGKLTVLFDWQALGDEGWPATTQMKLVAHEKSLREALDDLLAPMDLAWRALDENTLQITSLKVITTRPELELYRVDDLLDARPPAALVAAVEKALGGALSSKEGNSGAVRFDPHSNCLVVYLPQAQQRAVESLLHRWRTGS